MKERAKKERKCEERKKKLTWQSWLPLCSFSAAYTPSPTTDATLSTQARASIPARHSQSPFVSHCSPTIRPCFSVRIQPVKREKKKKEGKKFKMKEIDIEMNRKKERKKRKKRRTKRRTKEERK